MPGRDVKQNPKSEYRNPKQTKTPKNEIQNPKLARYNFLYFDHLNLFRISDPSTWLSTDFRASNFFLAPLRAFARDMVFPTS
jgi:hypothetical protein